MRDLSRFGVIKFRVVFRFHRLGCALPGFHFHRAWLELSKRIGQIAEVVAL
jgi:hypothetical protein